MHRKEFRVRWLDTAFLRRGLTRRGMPHVHLHLNASVFDPAAVEPAAFQSGVKPLHSK